MIAKKKKLSKKEMQEDKLVTTYFQAQQFFEDNRTMILSVIAAVVIVVAAIAVYTNKVEQDNLAATTQLSRVMDIYNSGSFQEAIDGRPGTNLIGLQSIVNEYGGSEQGENARILLANAHYFLGDYDAAEESYSSYSGDNPLFKASAVAGVAACKEAQGDFEEAADLYVKAAGIDGENPSNADYLLKAGINYKKINDFEEAEEMFSKVKNDYPGSLAAADAGKYLTVVKN